MNIAIVIGVSQYQGNNNLPGCKNDADYINQVLTLSKKFDSILFLNNGEDSSTVKERVNSFIEQHENERIDDLFFYFTGHGLFTGGEFYYILSDFDSKRRNQTTLQNIDLDNLFKSLKPNLVVKIVDACQSGTSYIKENEAFAKYFDGTKKGFNNCYFLNSSMSNQSSFQNDYISIFTKSVIKALVISKTTEIRYKAIVDVIIDDFVDNPEQTPYFVMQGALTHKFYVSNHELRTYLDSIKPQILDIPTDAKSSPTLVDLVIKDAEDYTNKEGAVEALILVQEKLNNLDLRELNDLYTINIEYFDNYSRTPKLSVIDYWLTTQSHEYFANAVYEISYDDYGNEYDSRIVGYDLNIDVPFTTVSIDLKGKYPNLTNYNCHVMYLLSKKYIQFFFYIEKYTQKNWDDEKLEYTSDSKWRTLEQIITDRGGIIASIDVIRNNIQNTITRELESRLNGSVTTAASDGWSLDVKTQEPTADDLPF